MRHGVRDPLRFDVFRDAVDVVRQRAKLTVLLRVDAEHQQVQLAIVFGKPAGDFLADQDVVSGPRQREHAVDRVVVGDGDEIHPAPFRLRVDFQRIAIALRAGDGVEHHLGRLVGGVAVAVQIDPSSRHDARPFCP